MLKGYKKFLVILLVGYIIIALIPVDRSNPPIKNEPQLPANVKAIFKKSCYDCHSNEVNYPFYSYLPPASWIVSGDVQNGRKHLNFSEWDNNKEYKLKEEIWEEVAKGEMPLSAYTFMHPSAKLTQDEKNAIENWAKDATNKNVNFKAKKHKEAEEYEHEREYHN